MSFRIVLEADSMPELEQLIARLVKAPRAAGHHPPSGTGTPKGYDVRKYSREQMLAAVRESKRVGVATAAKNAGMAANTLYLVRNGRTYKDLWPEVQKIMAEGVAP